MIGAWEVPRIERIWSGEVRRLGVLPVPGLSGDLHQDLGRSALVVEIEGSLHGDEARDTFLQDLREKFYEGEPVDFIADIVGEAELEQVVLERFEVEEAARAPDQFRYRIRLREYTEPPEPPLPASDLGLDELEGLDLDADLGLDLLDLPGIMADVPEIGELLTPVEDAARELRSTLEGASDVLSPLGDILD